MECVRLDLYDLVDQQAAQLSEVACVCAWVLADLL